MQHRIAALPRRNWEDLVDETLPILNGALLKCGAQGSLRPIQAVSIREALECGGVFVMADVGMGKTLISLLVGEVMDEERVLVLVPNGDKAKTEDEFEEYRRAWRGVDGVKYKLWGYTDVSRWPKEGYSIQRLWDGKGPTLIVCDEADKLRRVHADSGASGLALQVSDYLRDNPHCKLVALTATPDKSGVSDYAHILRWCLGDGSPLPHDPDEVLMWASVIDKGDTTNARKVCYQMGIAPTDDIEEIRSAYHMRLKQTPGVLITDEGFLGPLSFECHLIDTPPLMVPHFHRARKLAQRPDGWDLSPDGPSPEDEERRPDRIAEGGVWACCRQLALGFCYVADPVPPVDWMDARRMWFRAVRASLRDRDLGLYTTLQVAQMAAQGLLRPIHQSAWERWQEFKPTFEPGSKALWFSDHMLDWCADWGREAPGIVYVDHIAFGLELSKRTGWKYFGQGGRCGKQRIDKLYKLGQPAKETVIAARAACGTGKNLQAWNRVLFTAPPANNRDFQQNVGRIHRAGQWRPCKVDVVMGCKEHFESVAKVLDDAARQSKSIMQQKATMFEWQFPSDLPEGVVFND